MTAAQFDAFRDDQILGAGDTRHVCCGCGGLCDSKEPCPMRQWCLCRGSAIFNSTEARINRAALRQQTRATAGDELAIEGDW